MAIGATDPNDRGTLAAVATATALAGGIVKGAVFDRPRVLFALPHARAEGKLAKWGMQLVTGMPSNDVVPITGGTIRIAGTTLTTNAWKRSYQVSNALALGIVGVNMLYGIPNLVDGWRSGDGIGGVMESRAGRTGVFASISGLVELGLFTYAIARTPGSVGSRLVGALQHPLLSSSPVVTGRLAMALPIMANEAGYLDFLNRGNELGVADNARATFDSHVDMVRDFVDRD